MERQDFEIVSIHYNTPDLFELLYLSIRKVLGKNVPIRIIDGSEVYQPIFESHKFDSNLSVDRIGYNIHHGNGMDYAIRTSKYKYILILDSDCIILREDLIDVLFKQMDDNTYGVGKVYKVLPNGIDTDSFDNFILYLHPKTMLLNKDMYNKYAAFKNHGSPCIYAMTDINLRKDYHVIKCIENLSTYVFEKGRGTVERFGYGLRRSVVQKEIYFDNSKITFNILVRTSGRPNYFKNCLNSIRSQIYKNYRIIVSVDDDETYNYVSKHNIQHIVRNVRKDIPNPRPVMFDETIGRRRQLAPYNLYFSKMKAHCDPAGYVIFLDDDDMFMDSKSLYNIYKEIRTENDLIFWKVQFPNRLVPSDDVWGQRPQCCNMASCGFSFHFRNWIDWDGWTMGDYKLASTLYERVKSKVYINRVLTTLQRKEANGLGRRDDL